MLVLWGRLGSFIARQRTRGAILALGLWATLSAPALAVLPVSTTPGSFDPFDQPGTMEMVFPTWGGFGVSSGIQAASFWWFGHSGARSLRVIRNATNNPAFYGIGSASSNGAGGLLAGHQYTVKAWVYVPDNVTNQSQGTTGPGAVTGGSGYSIAWAGNGGTNSISFTNWVRGSETAISKNAWNQRTLTFTPSNAAGADLRLFLPDNTSSAEMYVDDIEWFEGDGSSPSPSPSPSPSAVPSGSPSSVPSVVPSSALLFGPSVQAWRSGNLVVVHWDGLYAVDPENTVSAYFYDSNSNVAAVGSGVAGIGGALSSGAADIRRVALYTGSGPGVAGHFIGAVDVAPAPAPALPLATWRSGSDVVVHWDGASKINDDDSQAIVYYDATGATVASHYSVLSANYTDSVPDNNIRRIAVYSWLASNPVNHFLGSVEVVPEGFTPEGTLGGLTPDVAAQLLAQADKFLNIFLGASVALLALKWFDRAVA